jgi:hypothetical protein
VNQQKHTFCRDELSGSADVTDENPLKTDFEPTFGFQT